MKRWGVILVVIALLFVGLFAIVPGIAQAEEELVPQEGLVPCGGANQPACDLCHVFSLLNNILNFIFFRVVPPIAVVLIMIGGFFWFIAAGDPGKVKQGKDMFSAVAIGLILIYGAWIFVSTFLMWMGVAQWTGLGSWWQVDCKLGDLRHTASKAPSTGRPFGSPVCGTVTDPFGTSRPGTLSGYHNGIDIGTGRSVPVRATISGTVILAGYDENSPGAGLHIVVKSGDFTARYLHLNSIEAGVQKGERINRGNLIAQSGGNASQQTKDQVNAGDYRLSGESASKRAGFSTGYHTHYEVQYQGKPDNVNQGYGVCGSDGASSCATSTSAYCSW